MQAVSLWRWRCVEARLFGLLRNQFGFFFGCCVGEIRSVLVEAAAGMSGRAGIVHENGQTQKRH